MERILIVEDDEDIRDLLAETLKRWHYDPSVASNGKEGLEQFRSQPFPLVITDIRMPIMDGLKMLKTIKKENPKTSLIVITGYPSVDSAVESLIEGADSYLIKPINLDDLKVKIKKSFENRKIQQVLASTKIANFVLVALIPVWLIAGYLFARLLD
ncbi:response regulator [bacterium]|nr:response regulator [bacterium]RQV93286.1 MAG: response regulator [bacterium]